MNALVQQSTHSVGILNSMADRYGMDVRAFESTILSTVMPANISPSREMVAAFLLVAKQYNLNPFTKEIFAFPAKGGIQPVVSVDGWMKLINSHSEFDGMQFVDALAADGSLLSVTCRIFRKDRTHPVEVTEYMSECRRNTDTWKQWPARMLRHKAAIQSARYAFGFAGIMEPDEFERMTQNEPANIPPAELIEDERKRLCDETAEQYSASVEAIKDAIAKFDVDQDNPNHLYSAAEAWREIPQKAQQDLWLAPSKGGIFTTHERDVLKTRLPRAE